jgi:hypothetical protein
LEQAVQRRQQESQGLSCSGLGLDEAVTAPVRELVQHTLLDSRHGRKPHHVDSFEESGVQLPSHGCVRLGVIVDRGTLHEGGYSVSSRKWQMMKKIQIKRRRVKIMD